MAALLFDAILITIIGMSLVFGAILLLWGLMSLLMRLTAKSDDAQISGDVRESDENRRKELAAVIAVSYLLAKQDAFSREISQIHEFPLPPTAVVSPWQAVSRAHVINKRGRVR